MEMIRTRQQVENDQIIVKIPDGFKGKEVDVIILPVRQRKRRFESLDLISLKTKDVRFDRNELHQR
jgi:hypothetical protein